MLLLFFVFLFVVFLFVFFSSAQVVAEAEVEQLRNTFLNLAIPSFAQSEPAPPPKRVLAPGVSVTPWDRWEFKGATAKTTLRDLLQWMEDTHHVKGRDVLWYMKEREREREREREKGGEEKKMKKGEKKTKKKDQKFTQI